LPQIQAEGEGGHLGPLGAQLEAEEVDEAHLGPLRAQLEAEEVDEVHSWGSSARLPWVSEGQG